MTPSEYEEYVQQVVQQLTFWEGANVYRNKRFPGVRQPGEYEVDIAFELFLSELVFFRLIVECKNHARPVTRPVVQNLAQTRDAIGAHKAAIASPIGFSEEAIEVAKALGIALWVVAKDIPVNIIMAYEGLKILGLSEAFYRLRTSYLALFGIEANSDLSDRVNIVNANSANPITRQPPLFDTNKTDDNFHFWRGVNAGSAHFSYENHPLFDSDCAQLQILDCVFESIGAQMVRNEGVEQKVRKWEEEVIRNFKPARAAEAAIAFVKSNEQERFFKLLW